MKRRAFLLFSILLLVPLSGCDLLEELTGVDEDEATFELTASVLSGKIIAFSNPSPNTSIGELPEWDYSFRSPHAIACNPQRDFTSDGWEVMDAKTLRIYFGQHYEQYRLDSMEGTLEGGDLRGTFHLTSSVAGNVVDGSFRQVPQFRFATCP